MLQRSHGAAERQPTAAPVTDQSSPDMALLHLPSRPNGYVPIADYGVVGDTRTMALVARDGSIDWLCLPNIDDAPIFGALLDRNRGGHFLLGVAGPCQIERHYAADSAVLVTRYTTANGVVEITDFMPLALRGTDAPIEPARRLVRIVEAIEGRPEICIHFAPRLAYGEATPELRRAGTRSWVFADGNDFLLLQSDVPLTPATRGVLLGKAQLHTGEKRRFTLSFCRGGPGIIPANGAAADRECEETLAFWQRFCAGIDYDGPFRTAVLRSLMTLRLLTFSQSGAVVAAATTSLPEAIGGRRNWDYRFCWLRDSYFVLNSFMDLGLAEEGCAFFRWLMHATQLTAPRLNTLYTVFGRTDTATPHDIKSLEGYRGSGPVRRGNGAVKQFQLDAHGAVLVCALILAEHGGDIGRAEQRRLRGFADAVRQDWTLPDNGLWEMRGPRKHHTYSKLMCWAALDAMVRLTERGTVDADATDYKNERDLIRDIILRQAWNAERGAFTGAFGHDYVDASLLLMPRLGFLPADDPRMVSTFDAIERALGNGAELHRYRDGVDGFARSEGTFTACGFWAADYLARRGDVDAARRRIADLLARANDVGLMAEQLDPESGEQLGNFPQALSHTAFIEATLALQQAERKAAMRAP